MQRRLAVLLSALSTLATGTLGAASYRLDQGQASSEHWFESVSPDGAWVVYAQDVDDDEAYELWKAPLAGGAPARISNGLLPIGSSAELVAFAPDSSQILFRAPQDSPGVLELYRAPLAGTGPSSKLSGGRYVDQPALSSDGSRAVWIEDAPPGGRRVYSRPADGSGPATPLSPATDATRDIVTFTISPDSAWVVFHADHTTDQRFELYSVPIGGGTVRRLCGAMPAGANVWEPFRVTISADSSRVVFMADLLVDGLVELFSTAIAPPPGAEPIRLSGPMVGDVASFALTANGQRAIYRADQQLAGRHELYSVPVAGGTPVKLNPVLGTTDEIREYDYELSGNSARAVFKIYRANMSTVELWSAPTQGPATSAVKLDQTGPSGGWLQEFVVSPDSSRVVYRGSLESSGRNELWSVALDGSVGPAKLNPSPLTGTWDTQSFALSPDSSRVFFVHSFFSNFTSTWSERLFEAPLTGGTVRSISGPLVNPEPWNPFHERLLPHPDSRRVLWTYLPPDLVFSSQLWIGDSTLFSDGWESGAFVRWSAKRP